MEPLVDLRINGAGYDLHLGKRVGDCVHPCKHMYSFFMAQDLLKKTEYGSLEIINPRLMRKNNEKTKKKEEEKSRLRIWFFHLRYLLIAPNLIFFPGI